MSEAQHTPGPWMYHKQLNGSLTFFGENGNRVILSAARLINQEANARLIAAAPELLAALQSIAEYWNQDRNDEAMFDACHYAIDTAMDAIAKVEGGAA